MDNNNTSRATEEEDRGGHDDHQVHGGLGSKRQRQESSSSSSSSSSTSFRSANEDMSSSSSGNDDNDDEDGNEGEESDDDGVGRRRRKVRRTDSRSEEQAEGGAANRRPAVLDKGRAICPYNLLRDISHRQFGLITPGTFRCNRMGSLSLAGRMELAYLLEGHQGCVNSLHFNPSGSLLASGSDDLDIIIWDWKGKKRKLLSYESGHRANVFQSKFLPLSGDSLLVSSSRDGQVRLGELCEGGTACRDTKKLAQHKGPSNKLALNPLEPHVFLSGGEDAVVFSIDVREQKPATKLLEQRDSKRHTVPIYSVDAHPSDGNIFCTSGMDSYVRLFDRRNPQEAYKQLCPSHLTQADCKANVTSAVFNRDGSEIVASYNDDDIYLFNLRNPSSDDEESFSKRFMGHRNSNTVKGVNFYGPRSEFIISGSDCGNIFIWSKSTEGIIHMFEGDESGIVNVLEPHPNLPYLATSGLDDQVKIWLPTSECPTSDDVIEKTVIRNTEEKREGINDHDLLRGGEWMVNLMRQFHRSEIRRRQRNGEEVSNDSEDDGDDDVHSDDSDNDGDFEGPVGIQCPTS